jgi:hypothetical protein
MPCHGELRASRYDVRVVHNVTLAETNFSGVKLTGAKLSSAYFDDVDVSAFCDARGLEHLGPSSIDCRTVMKSYLHPNLRPFMTDCGVPEIFATYMIDCARASGDPLLRSLMQSTFISYGGPDELFAPWLRPERAGSAPCAAPRCAARSSFGISSSSLRVPER